MKNIFPKRYKRHLDIFDSINKRDVVVVEILRGFFGGRKTPLGRNDEGWDG